MPNTSVAHTIGTLVPPFIGVRVDEVVDLAVDKDGDGKISPGDEVEYTVSTRTGSVWVTGFHHLAANLSVNIFVCTDPSPECRTNGLWTMRL